MYQPRHLTQREAAQALADLLHTANMADSDSAMPWQKPSDARSLYHAIRDACIVARLESIFAENVLSEDHNLDNYE